MSLLGVGLRRPSRTLAAAFVCAAGLAAPGLVAQGPTREANRSADFTAFQPEPDDARLPLELRRLPARASEAAPAERYGLRIEWSSRERPGLLGYRVTARVDGGPLSGVAAQWRVLAGTGLRADGSGALHYRLLLPLSVNLRSRVEAAIEAVVEHGEPVLLAVREAHPWTDSRGHAELAPAGSREASGAAQLASARLRPAPQSLASNDTASHAVPASVRGLIPERAPFGLASQARVARGPPASVLEPASFPSRSAV